MEPLKIAKRVFQTEIEAMQNVSDNLDDIFIKIINKIMECKGKIICVGMGKSGHVAKKIAASMSSLGTCAICIHPGECMHGDLGMIQKQDVVILISYSGESDEIVRILPSIRIIGAYIIGITCNPNSTLAKNSSIVQVFTGIKEACHLGLAPTTSTTVVMAYGDALAVVASELKGFSKSDFGVFHPAGSLGKRITIRAVDLMQSVHSDNVIKENSTITEAIVALVESEADIVAVSNEDDKLIGIVTNSDLKNIIHNKIDVYNETIENMIHWHSYFVDSEAMAIEALRIMEENKVYSLPIVNEDKIIGIISKNDILKVGIYL